MSTKILDVRGGRAVRRMLDGHDGREGINRIRRGVRAAAAVFRTGLRSEAKARADIPDSFAKTKTKNSTHGGISTAVGPTSPLFNIFEGGATSHVIKPKRGKVMRGEAGQHYRGAAFFAAGPVSHPGMAARPLAGPVFAHRLGAAEAAASAVIFAAPGVKVG